MNCSLSNAMSARALLYSLSLTPKAPPDISVRKKILGSDSKPRCPFPFLIRVRFSSSQEQRYSVFRVAARRSSGKVWADVKSETYDISDSVPDSVKFEEALDGVVLGEEEKLESSVSWREQFPKRWVIVVLCFSAFLLCNMDRVSSFCFSVFFFFLFFSFLLCVLIVMFKMKLRKLSWLN
jgi:ACS family sodium-dependent inorganic phosphate cotransporter